MHPISSEAETMFVLFLTLSPELSMICKIDAQEMSVAFILLIIKLEE